MSPVSELFEEWLEIEKLLNEHRGDSNVSTLQQVKDLIKNEKYYDEKLADDYRHINNLISDKLELQKKTNDLEFRNENLVASKEGLQKEVDELTLTLATIEEMAAKHCPNDPCGVILQVASICDSRNWYKNHYEKLLEVIDKKEEIINSLRWMKDKIQEGYDTLWEDVEVAHVLISDIGLGMHPVGSPESKISNRVRELIADREAWKFWYPYSKSNQSAQQPNNVIETTESTNGLKTRILDLETALGVIYYIIESEKNLQLAISAIGHVVEWTYSKKEE